MNFQSRISAGIMHKTVFTDAPIQTVMAGKVPTQAWFWKPHISGAIMLNAWQSSTDYYILLGGAAVHLVVRNPVIVSTWKQRG